jgi:hypothetical protein
LSVYTRGSATRGNHAWNSPKLKRRDAWNLPKLKRQDAWDLLVLAQQLSLDRYGKENQSSPGAWPCDSPPDHA